jgi:phosphonate dehydrogenase
MDLKSRAIVYYTHPVYPEALDLLAPFCVLRVHDGDHPPAPGEIIGKARDAHALGWFLPDVIDETLLSACPNLRILAGFPRGYDNVDVAAATRKSIWVTIGPDLMVEPTADLAWGLLLSLARKIIPSDTFVKSTRSTGWHPSRFLGHSVSRTTLGLIGMGRLGQAMARRAAGFEMRVLYYDLKRAPDEIERNLNLTFVSVEDLLRKSDFVCLASPLTEGTYHQISRKELALMKPTAFLINPARGSEVDEEAVSKALENGSLAGYAADVFEMEDGQFPKRSTEVTIGLIDHPEQTVLTPHIGTAVKEIRIEMARYQALNILQALRGERPIGAINDVPKLPPLL